MSVIIIPFNKYFKNNIEYAETEIHVQGTIQTFSNKEVHVPQI